MPAEMSTERLQAHFAAISKRFAALEAQVAILSANADIPYQPVSAEVPPEVVELVQAGKELEAVKKYRELTGATAEQAREAIASA